MIWTAWVYGSVARGDHNPASSDLDILLISDIAIPQSEYEQLLAPLPCLNHLSLAHYSWDEVGRMGAYGSLFLWHVRMEGRPLTSGLGTDQFSRLLGSLPGYAGATRDLIGFKTGIEDARTSLLEGGDPSFELSVLATIIRHASILACAQLGEPTYARNDSMAIAFKAHGLEAYLEEALQIYQFRLSTARNLPPTLKPTIELATIWTMVASKLIDSMEKTHAC